MAIPPASVVSLRMLVKTAAVAGAMEYMFRAWWVRSISPERGRLILRWLDFSQVLITAGIAKYYLGEGLGARTVYIGLPLLSALIKAAALEWIPIPEIKQGLGLSTRSVSLFADYADHGLRMAGKEVNLVCTLVYYIMVERRTGSLIIYASQACHTLRDIGHTIIYLRRWSNSFYMYILEQATAGTY
jgi:hypothetical protein